VVIQSALVGGSRQPEGLRRKKFTEKVGELAAMDCRKRQDRRGSLRFQVFAAARGYEDL